ncbi:MAG: hypothetical protein RLZZ488_2755 [Pseudomonadota bacterium]|jgi:membrane associated rhomboid family serine protease
MLIVPYGIGHRLPRFPLITLSIAVAWLLLFVFGENISQQMGDVTRAAWTYSDYRGKAGALYREACAAEKIQAQQCEQEWSTAWGLMLMHRFDPGDAQEEKLFSETSERIKTLSRCMAARCRDELKRIEKFTHESANGYLSFSGYSAFAALSSADQYVLEKIRAWQSESHRLTRENITIQSVSDAHFRHGSLSHFWGNTLVFILVGIAVESALAPWWYILIAALAGSAGMLFDAINLQREVILLGGSAIVSAVAGMYYAMFSENRMNVLCWIPFRWAVFKIPVKYMLPFLTVASDLHGFIGSLRDPLGGGVAHGAHLMAFVIGALLTALIKLSRGRPPGFIFLNEEKRYEALMAESDVGVLIDRAASEAGINPDNPYPAGLAIHRGFTLLNNEPLHPLRNKIVHFSEQYFADVLALTMKFGMKQTGLGLLELCPKDIRLIELTPRTGQLTWLGLAESAVNTGRLTLAVRCLDAYLFAYPLSRQSPAVLSSVDSIARHMAERGELHHLMELRSCISNRIVMDCLGRYTVEKTEVELDAG